jgi:hypothetical protein
VSNNDAAFQFLTGLGLSDGAAEGVIGNWLAESGKGGQIDPGAVQPGGPGRGIEQWSVGDRWAKLIAWAKGQGEDPLALDTQMQYSVQEMMADGTFGQLQATNDPLAAATLFMRQEERPADQSAAAAKKRSDLGVQAVGGHSAADAVKGVAADAASAVTNAVNSAIGSAFSSFWTSAKPFIVESAFVVAGVVLVAAGVTRAAKNGAPG